MKKSQRIGYVYMVAGFLIILINALQYLLSDNATLFSMTIIGIALFVVGLNWMKNDK